MTAILSWLTGKVAGPVFGIALIATSIAFAVTVGVYHFELASETARADKLEAAINAPSTGWVARNAQCETNVATLSVALDRVRGEVAELAKATAEGDAKTAVAIAGAASQIGRVRVSTEKLLATPPSAPIGSIDACRSGARILKTGAP